MPCQLFLSQLLLLSHFSHVQLCVTPWTAAHQASLSITNSRSLLKHMSIESVMPSNHLILCRPLLLLPPIPPSIRIFSNEAALCMGWPKYWSFSFNISHPGLISFRMDWLDRLAVQGTLKSLLQHHSSKASILRHAGKEGPHLEMTVASRGFSLSAAPVWGFSRGMTGSSGSLSCGAREVRAS